MPSQPPSPFVPNSTSPSLGLPGPRLDAATPRVKSLKGRKSFQPGTRTSRCGCSEFNERSHLRPASPRTPACRRAGKPGLARPHGAEEDPYGRGQQRQQPVVQQWPHPRPAPTAKRRRRVMYLVAFELNSLLDRRWDRQPLAFCHCRRKGLSAAAGSGRASALPGGGTPRSECYQCLIDASSTSRLRRASAFRREATLVFGEAGPRSPKTAGRSRVHQDCFPHP
jgi:hypothetical protein